MERFFQYAILGLVSSGYLAVVSSGLLDLPTAVLAGLALLLRALMVSGVIPIPIPPKAALWATLAYIPFYPLDYFLLSREFIPATVHLIFFLSSIRILTARTHRDFLYVQLLALLEILAACILSSQLNFLLFLAAFILFGLAAMASGEIRRAASGLAGEPARTIPARRAEGRLAMFLAFSSVAIFAAGAGLFFVLPRTARAAFHHLAPARYHLPGFSSEVTLGQIGEIKLSADPLLYVKMLGDYQPRDLKWRGSALQSFDGKRWFNPRSQEDKTIDVQGRLIALTGRRPVATKRFHYEVRVKDIASDVIFFAGKPEFLSIDTPQIVKSATGGYRAPLRPASGFRYAGYSYEDTIVYDPSLVEPMTEAERVEYLRVPHPADPRLAGLAASLVQGARSKEEEARAIEYRLQHDYGYSLRMPDHEPADPVAHFLFERRKGHCEYFASAMAVLLRLRGIPSRVVTGFQENAEDAVNGWRIIRASDAHSWVEAYLPERGWMVFDPTPADPGVSRFGFLTRMARVWDAMEVFWSDWIVSYDFERQMMLAARMQRSSRGTGVQWLDGMASAATWLQEEFIAELKRLAAPLGVGLIGSGLAVVFGPRVWRELRGRWRIGRIRARRGGGAHDATVLYERLLEILHKRGIEKPDWLTPMEFAGLVSDPETAAHVLEFTEAYHQMRYGGRREALPRMFAVLERLQA